MFFAMARRVRTIIRSILGFAEGRGWVERNVALSNTEELKIRHVVTSNPAIERPADLGKFLLRLDDLNLGSVAYAMRLLVLLPVRPGELVKMRWEDVDLIGADCRYVVSKTKHLEKSKHIVPLPEQALVLLRELHKDRVVDDAGNGWVFGSQQKQRTEEAIYWRNENSLWRNGHALRCQVAKRPDTSCRLNEFQEGNETRIGLPSR